jgi:hypothetical protein
VSEVDDVARRFRRQQRRRAAIGWTSAVIVIGLIVAAAIFGKDETKNESERPNPFGYSMTAKQYASLRPGLEEELFVNRLEQTGLPENLTKGRYVRLFPSHGDNVTCSYWEISGRAGVLARVCFSSPKGLLVQKLERNAAGAFGVNA